MNKREKILVMAISGLVLLFIGRTITKKYFAALAEKNGEIIAIQKKLDGIRSAQHKAEEGQKRWKEIGRQTLSMDPNEATSRLREELFDLVDKSGLTKAEIDLGSIGPWQKNNVRVLGCALTAQGTMKEIVSFLYDLYRAPYLIRCRNLTIAQIGGKAPKGSLKISAKMETLILPANVKVPKIVPAILDKEKRKEFPRTELVSLEDYKSILDAKMWEEYVPRVDKASNPNPPVGGQAGAEVNFTWTPAPEATAHKIYFGTSPPGELVGEQPQPSFQKSGLTPGTYYWRIDEVFSDGPVTGDQWSFTIAPPPPVVTKATNPNPPVGGQAGPDINLTWTPAGGVTSHQVYFGTAAPGELAGTVNEPRFPRSGLLPSTTYYWRVDEVLADGTISIGDQWTFTTITPPPPPPPEDAAFILSRVLSSPRGQQAVLADPAQQGNPMAIDKRVMIGEKFYGGTLVYIHPKGAVSELNGALRFHALGQPLQQAQPLTEEVQPEVFHEVKKLEAQAAGISQGSG